MRLERAMRRRSGRRMRPVATHVRGVYLKPRETVRMAAVQKLAEEFQSVDTEKVTAENVDRMQTLLADMLAEFLCDKHGMSFDDVKSGADLRDKYGDGFVMRLGEDLHRAMGKLMPVPAAT